MDFQTYQQYFQEILINKHPFAPYDKPSYINYTKLNWSRMNRWLKQAIISDALAAEVLKIKTRQHWIIITEPWCGDAAHSVPILYRISLLNPLITVEFQLRDSEPFQINAYLTNGTKSIPKLIIRNEEGIDLVTWGPRPRKCQILYTNLKKEKADSETINIALQKWYNEFANTELQEEITELLKFASMSPNPSTPVLPIELI